MAKASLCLMSCSTFGGFQASAISSSPPALRMSGSAGPFSARGANFALASSFGNARFPAPNPAGCRARTAEGFEPDRRPGKRCAARGCHSGSSNLREPPARHRMSSKRRLSLLISSCLHWPGSWHGPVVQLILLFHHVRRNRSHGMLNLFGLAG